MSQTKAQLVQPVGIVTGTGINVTGVITATSFVGSGEGLTGVASTDNIITGTAATFNNTVQVNSTLTANSGFTTNAINTNLNVTGVTTIASAKILTGFTTNATNTNLKVTGVGTFAGNITVSNTNPKIFLTDTNNTSDYSIRNDNGNLDFYDETNSASRLKIVSTGDATFTGDVTAATGDIGNLNITKSAAGAGSTVGSFTGVTTYFGDGGSLTGVGESIAPWNYNPPLYATELAFSNVGIGITFNKKISGGTGNMYLKIANAGVGGTEIQRWGISSVTISQDPPTKFTATIISDLEKNKDYELSIDTGFFVDSAGKNLVGLAYTFQTKGESFGYYVWGNGYKGALGQNSQVQYSSPVQIPGSDFSYGTFAVAAEESGAFVRDNGTLWTMGQNSNGQLGHNSTTYQSSPTQIPGTTWTNTLACGPYNMACVKTDGTLWTWGYNGAGDLGQGNTTRYSSPVQVPGTWATGINKLSAGSGNFQAIKADGTMWMWGSNGDGGLAQNNMTQYSSPRQVGTGSDWASVATHGWQGSAAIKTDGTLWVWGHNEAGMLGINESAPGNGTQYSSPIQIPGTTWSQVSVSGRRFMGAVKTDGTLWSWGKNSSGSLGQGNQTQYSSPVQVPGTTWTRVVALYGWQMLGTKSNGELWVWGDGGQGQTGQNNELAYSSPRQIPGTNWATVDGGGQRSCCTQEIA